ncbi:hypothetical protein E4631_04750 [Hymenobacter sp. UV11]|uniref:hypothetical protein n=1 Tax=Hymenobacter sp. UV11 TaxID=1849735 RepID=UPI00105D6535|nr:hypothetical protein [Hymenobacter sp. UV11]TFZ68304.1 hypothetical protein E4631_04750 [Hymenobacter sp. UV11]
MRTTDKGFWLLVVVASCWLLSLALPIYQKLWFVAPSGHYGGGVGTSVLLLFLLFRRWRPARILMILICSLSVCVISSIIYYNFTHSGPLLGFCLTLPLELTALAILSYSTSVKHFLGSKSQAGLQVG